MPSSACKKGRPGDLERLAQLFFFNDAATTEIYTLSLHDALPIWAVRAGVGDARGERDVGLGHPTAAAVEAGVEGEVHRARGGGPGAAHRGAVVHRDRESTRLNPRHDQSSYAVFCLQKGKTR